MMMPRNVQGAENSSNYLSNLANVSSCNCDTTSDIGGVGGGGGAGGGGSVGGDCHGWWSSWGWGAGWGWSNGHNGGGGGGGGGGGAAGSFNSYGSGSTGGNVTGVVKGRDGLEKNLNRKNEGLYLLGEYVRCMKHGKCRGMKLICPLHCHGPCFYDCEYNCKAHCNHR